MLDAVEEALDQIALPVHPGAEDEGAFPVRAGWDVRPRAALGEARADGVRVVGAVGDHDCALRHDRQQLLAGRSVVGLAGGEEQAHGASFRVDECVDLGRQAAARTSHATISGGLRIPFFPAAPCWWTRTQELSIITMSPS